jgi:hypothetical protein
MKCMISARQPVIAGSPVMYSDLLNTGNVNGVGTSPLCTGFNLRLGYER